MRKLSKRFLVLLLAFVMGFSLVACGGENKDEAGNAAEYTYNTALADFPTNWSPFQNQTSTDSEILDYITEGFYVFDYNETQDGYQLVPGAAAAEPVDVTADYVGKYDIAEGETAKAWKIELRSDLVWEDGTPITAQDWVRSAELLLDPKAQNHRADTLYSGDLTVYNARNFLYAGQYDEITGTTYPEMSFEEVGIFALSDTELVLVLEKPLEGFYLLYSLTSPWLVNEELYLKCASETDGVYTNSYGTSAETTMSYGPYKLASFQADKQYILERNENFHGVKEGHYQTTTWQVDCVAEPSTRLKMFLNGQLDEYGLSAEDMETYATGDHTYYTTQDSTYFVALNPDPEGLIAAQEALGENFNKTILTVKEFRQALSFSLDRSAFALATLPTCNPAFGVYSSLIVSNPETGETYRSTEEAKWVLAEFWGVADDIGSGKLYENVDDAVASITGYNLEKAKQLFNEAYDIAIREGLMDEDDVIEIKIGLPNNTSQTYAKGYEFLVNCYTEAVKGTSLEGKLTFSKDDTLGNGFGEALRSNQVDLLFFVGWTGSALDPYGLMEAYTTAEYQYDPSWDTSAEMVAVTIDGLEYTASVLDWTYCMGGEEITITAADGSTRTFKAGANSGVDEVRFAILTALEDAVLSTYDMIPLVDDSTASLKGMQIRFYTEEYIFGVGRGGVKYMTYNYTDAEWDEFVRSQGGTLIYR